MAHTPTPWLVTQSGACETLIRAEGPHGKKIASTFISSYGGTNRDSYIRGIKTNEANAAHIVKCVNAHDELVNALLAAQVVLKLYAAQLFGDGSVDESPVVRTIQRALTKAGAA